jgi:MerR family transcriptional regulator, mercuric resistance operon regulatory protein
MRDDRLRIGEVAARAGVNVQTLRYYERRGLLAEPERTRSGYRLYPEETVQLVRFIKRAQELGFSLNEIEQLLQLRDDRVSSCEEVQALAEAKIETVVDKISQLSALKGALEVLVRSCERGDASRECPILEAIESAAGRTGLR